jgi:hypothetical protein
MRKDVIPWYAEIINDVIARTDMKTRTEIIQEVVAAVQ